MKFLILPLFLITVSYSNQYATVISSYPILENISIPTQNCTPVFIKTQDPYAPIIGGVIGGLIGNQFGKGSGKTIATISGSLVGTHIGSNHYNNFWGQSCQTSFQTKTVVNSYQVRLSYQNNIFEQTMNWNPPIGTNLPINFVVNGR